MNFLPAVIAASVILVKAVIPITSKAENLLVTLETPSESLVMSTSLTLDEMFFRPSVASANFNF